MENAFSVQRGGRRQVLVHTTAYLIARGLPGVIAFLAIPLFTRLLQPVDYGRYALLVATVNLLGALLFQGLRLSLVRYLPTCASPPARLKSTLVTTILLLLGFVGVLAVLLCLAPSTHRWWPELLGGWLLLALMAMFELCSEYLRTVLRPWDYMLLQLTRSAGLIGLGGTFILLGAGWWGPAAGMVGGMGLAVAWSYFKDWRDVRLDIDRGLLRQLSQYGIPLSLTVVLAQLMGTSDRLLIGALIGEGAAGLYSVAADLASQTVTLLLMAVYLAVFPLAVHAWEQEGPAAATAQMQYNASLLLALGVPCVVGMVILTPGISHCLLGSNYRQAASGVFPLIAVAAFVGGFKAYHFDAALQFAHRTIDQVWIVLVAVVANILMNLLAIPLVGIKGAATVSVLTYTIAVGLSIKWGRRYAVLPFPARPAVQVTLASAVMAAVLYPLRGHISPMALAGQVTAGVAVYAVVLLSCNFLDLRPTIRRKCRAAPVADGAAM
jgi:O-antigen/teichoic acid export membrane protein